ncbi:metal-dependent hydrolase [Methanogenium marinum]|uniref:metal-dependent hydrolase n=1 Tax=Methanogenium marinum TaxID=348610 RepID=UPI003B84B023
MLPAVHLLIGITLGIFLLYLTKDCRAIIYCAIGSLLPDIIDKPLGHIFLPSIGYGRIFFHSLTVCALVALLGVIILIKWRHPGLLFVAAGMLSHQLADGMWDELQGWFWPIFGGFPHRYMPNYFENMFSLELSSPSEMLLMALAVIFFLCFVYARWTGKNRIFHWASVLVGFLLFIAGSYILFGLVSGILPIYLIYSGCSNTLICGLSLIFGGVAILCVSFFPPVRCEMKKFL